MIKMLTLICILVPSLAWADCPVDSAAATELIHARYPNSDVLIQTPIMGGSTKIGFKIVSSVEKQPGHLEIFCQFADGGTDRKDVFFKANKTARISKKKILPNTPVYEADFTQASIDLTDWRYRGIAGLLLPVSQKIDGLETQQTLLEGSVLTANTVRKLYDGKKGDMIQIWMHSGGLLIKSSGILEEPGYVGDSVRISTLKNKRELTGKMSDSHVVEVFL